MLLAKCEGATGASSDVRARTCHPLQIRQPHHVLSGYNWVSTSVATYGTQHLRCITCCKAVLKYKVSVCVDRMAAVCSLMLQLQHCLLMSRNILPSGAALMFTLDEMSVLSKRIFFNSLTYQANKLLEKVNISLLQLYRSLDFGYSSTVEKIILFFPSFLSAFTATCMNVILWFLEVWLLLRYCISRTYRLRLWKCRFVLEI